MATKKPAAKKAAKRKFSPAQLAAQKLFAQRARAGKLAKERAHHQASGKRRKRNPELSKGLHHTSVRTPLAYQVCTAVHGVAGKTLASFPTKAAAVEYGQAYVRSYGKPVVIVGKGL